MTDWSRTLSAPSPRDVGDRSPLLDREINRLDWRERRPLLFDLYWLREGVGSVLTGDFGVPVKTSTAVDVCYRLEGGLRIAFFLSDAGRIRLQLSRVPGNSQAASCRVSLVGDPEPVEPVLETLIGVSDLDHALSHGLSGVKAFNDLPQPTRAIIRELGGRILSDPSALSVRRRIEAVRILRDCIYRRACRALERKREVQLACCREPLLDCSFAPSPEGIERCLRTLSGDLPVLEIPGHEVRFRKNVLNAEARVELHLPLLERKWWTRRLDLFPTMPTRATADGRVFVFRGDLVPLVEAYNGYQSSLLLCSALPWDGEASSKCFSLAFSDRRRMGARRAALSLDPLLRRYSFDDSPRQFLARLPDDAQVQADLSLRIPGELTASWMMLRNERFLDTYFAYTGVASAVQAAMRTWIPYVYFQDIDRYDDVEIAYPLVVYQASKPYRRKRRTEFTYDPMNPNDVNLAFRQSTRALPRVLRAIDRDLRAAGKTDVARLYMASRARKIVAAVRGDSKRFRGLLASDALFMRELVKLGNRGSKLREELQTSPESASKKLARFFETFAHSFHTRLRRLYGGQECLSFASLIFVEATRALSAALGVESPMEVVLRIGEDSGSEHIFCSPCQTL